MAKFNSANLDPTEYDFTEFPHKDQPTDGATKFCSGKGVIAEPSDEQVDAFQVAALKLERAGRADDSMSFSEARKATTETLVNLNVPQEHLDELPAKYYLRFVGFVLGEFLPGNELGA